MGVLVDGKKVSIFLTYVLIPLLFQLFGSCVKTTKIERRPSKSLSNIMAETSGDFKADQFQNSDGLVFKALEDISKSEFMEICDELTDYFGVVVTPDPITEGGFKIHTCKGYKCFRFYYTYKYKQGQLEWEWITDETPELWRHTEEILIPKGYEFRTRVKAFSGAELWTLDELRAVREILSNHGFKVNKTLPTKKSLKMYCDRN